MIKFIKKHKQHLPAFALVTGLVWDTLTLGRPDQLYGNLVLLSYLFIAGFCIIVMTRREEKGKKRLLWLVLMTQFAFGNLTGGLLVLYVGSATLAGNWPFLLLFIGLMIGNEIFNTRHTQIRFNTTVYYLLVLAYLILIVPVLTRSVESWTFLVSAFGSLVVIYLFIQLLKLVGKTVVAEHMSVLKKSIAGTLIIFSFLFYANLIPPVPLSVRDIGIFHGVERTGEEYRLTYQKPVWYKPWEKSDTRIFLGTTSAAHCFSAVFAPTDLRTPIFHVWEEYSDVTEEWEERGRFRFPITGGRVSGYRGYSTKTVDLGEWRCSVETERGALLGRVGVEVVSGRAGNLISEIR